MNLVQTPEGLLLGTPNTGKRVVFTPVTKKAAQILAQAAKEGYYYPMMALKQLEALSTGLGGKTNVFIPNINDFKTNSFQQVVVFVPGIVATVERRPNDTLAITKLELSDDYKSIEKGSLEKPGVYSVSKSSVNGVAVNFQEDGQILSENNRLVVIADPKYAEPKLAAQYAAKKLGKLFGDGAAKKCDFDLFFSPLGSELRGMRNYNPHVANKTYAFSGLLADAMEKSNNISGVEWTSEHAGSLVLTQALMTLDAKNVSFKDKNHVVKMCWAKSNPQPAFNSAKRMGMLSDNGLLSSNSHVRPALASLKGNFNRLRDKDDDYGLKDYAGGLGNGLMDANGLVSLGLFTGSIATGGAALLSAGFITGAVGSTVFALQKVKTYMDDR
ncbi:MAG: hypothetical protein KYX62_10455 [Pseudomonadota bacterium]|nr:hypothetical protein [Pseudomonadota bacterium]